jgi:hypothetical protein
LKHADGYDPTRYIGENSRGKRVPTVEKNRGIEETKKEVSRGGARRIKVGK